MQQRLKSSRRGRMLTEFVERHPADLLNMLLTDGDVRRATISALQPILAGATTTTDVLTRVIAGDDARRLDKMSEEVLRKASPQLRRALRPLMALNKHAEGKSLARIFGLKT
jgi:hypothetical protein